MENYKSIFKRYEFLDRYDPLKYKIYLLGLYGCCPFVICFGCFFAYFYFNVKEQEYLYTINKILNDHEKYELINPPLAEEDPIEAKDKEFRSQLNFEEEKVFCRYLTEVEEYKLKLKLDIERRTCENCKVVCDNIKNSCECGRKIVKKRLFSDTWKAQIDIL